MLNWQKFSNIKLLRQWFLVLDATALTLCAACCSLEKFLFFVQQSGWKLKAKKLNIACCDCFLEKRAEFLNM